jgi:hypothetical protein
MIDASTGEDALRWFSFDGSPVVNGDGAALGSEDDDKAVDGTGEGGGSCLNFCCCFSFVDS